MATTTGTFVPPSITQRLYEGMFLINPATVNSSVAQAIQLVRELLERQHAEVLSIARWDERKLAYEIGGQKRGMYILAYFRIKGQLIANLERDVELSEQFIRSLIVRADHIGEAELEQARQDAETSNARAAVEGAGEQAAGGAEAPAEAKAVAPREEKTAEE